MADKQLLFYPGYGKAESDTFYLGEGEQITLVALGLQPGDSVGVQIVYSPAIEPDPCTCPPAVVELPSVMAAAPLPCIDCAEGREPKLTADAPVLIFDYPQGFHLRAVIDAQDEDAIWVWMNKTRSRPFGNCCFERPLA